METNREPLNKSVLPEIGLANLSIPDKPQISKRESVSSIGRYSTAASVMSTDKDSNMPVTPQSDCGAANFIDRF